MVKKIKAVLFSENITFQGFGPVQKMYVNNFDFIFIILVKFYKVW